MFELALPVIISYLGIMTMGLVDLICVGRVSPIALGAVGVGTSIFSWFMIFGMGCLPASTIWCLTLMEREKSMRPIYLGLRAFG